MNAFAPSTFVWKLRTSNADISCLGLVCVAAIIYLVASKVLPVFALRLLGYGTIRGAPPLKPGRPGRTTRIAKLLENSLPKVLLAPSSPLPAVNTTGVDSKVKNE
eukprot:gnl/Spiro4/12667_TR6705_c0_g1_i2.p1 gnl/Spiro4/12667_TR6705_c0_g1~~gnl/Spiro4/12667_TR6705_c0_g1_i2.p1  ORF type:complete len:123 (+),score=25.03 gnl/Spiro4/12667_TR6705_c0_g1_i2:56-370(+)